MTEELMKEEFEKGRKFPFTLKKHGVRTLAVLSVAVVALMGGSAISARYQRAHKCENLFRELDACKTVIFGSVPSCQEHGISLDRCQASLDSALALQDEPGGAVEYSTLAACADAHGEMHCFEEEKDVFRAVLSGPTISLMRTLRIVYKPLVAAWQAAALDLNKAVPLYPTPITETVVRGDGKKFENPHF